MKFLIYFSLSISGNEEGGFGWIAFNYLKKIIGPKKVRNRPDIFLNYIAMITIVGLHSTILEHHISNPCLLTFMYCNAMCIISLTTIIKMVKRRIEQISK